MSKHIPESKYAVGKRDAEVVELGDIQYECALLAAQLEAVRKNPRLLASIGQSGFSFDEHELMCSASTAELLLSPAAVVLKLAQLNKFNMAIATAKSLDVDLSELFAHLTMQCLRLARNPDIVL